ncbi:MAG TPA: T9SS type A sorting domain-containing protein [Flavobacterium sp.]
MGMLLELRCNNINQLVSINLSGAAGLSAIYVAGNSNLTSLDLSGSPLITDVFCQNNALTQINITGLTNLHQFFCDGNQLTSLNLSEVTSPVYATCNDNLLTELIMPQNFSEIDCRNNLLTELEVNGGGSTLNCENNQLTTLDISNSTVVHLWTSGNPLTFINVKNGVNGFCAIEPTPQLQYICADDGETISPGIEEYFPVVNSYCSFVPGGNYNTITGSLTYDNGSGTCGPLGFAEGIFKVKLEDGNTSGYAFPNANTDYTFYTGSGTFTLTPEFENAAYFTATPASAVVSFASADSLSAVHNFCISPNGVHPDVEVVISAMPPSPGFNSYYQIIYRNKGNQAMFGQVNFNYNESLSDFVSADPIPSSQTSGNVQFNYYDLQPFETRSAILVLNINAPTDTPAINIGDVFLVSATVSPLVGDETIHDNEFSMEQTVVGSFDPNDITCLEGDIESPAQIGEYLHYLIRFENTGTANAINVVVKDVIDASKFDISSIQLMDTSHDAQMRLTGNKAEFVFENIQLAPDANGYVLFKIRSNNALTVGSSVSQFADIYFDHNFPVVTNTATTTFQTLGVAENHLQRSLKIAPNPAGASVLVQASAVMQDIKIYDLQGRLVLEVRPNEIETNMDLSTLQAGIYQVVVDSGFGTAAAKLVRQ